MSSVPRTSSNSDSERDAKGLGKKSHVEDPNNERNVSTTKGSSTLMYKKYPTNRWKLRIDHIAAVDPSARAPAKLIPITLATAVSTAGARAASSLIPSLCKSFLGTFIVPLR